MRGCEIRHLRWRDIDLLGRTVTIRKSKTEAGQRVIPLNKAAFAAIWELRRRSRQMGTQHATFTVPVAESFDRPKNAGTEKLADSVAQTYEGY